ncbi:MAG: TRAP transporter small permease subunit [Dehalococcoidales bacterium]|nr:TRAP transporter small permease subunit [Dehalococcoidales bacterium]
MKNSSSNPQTAGERGIILKMIDRISYWSSFWFERFAMVGIVGIIIATLIDVIGAKLFSRPLAAGTEVVYFLQIIAIAGGLAFAQINHRHVRLEFVDAFPKIIRGVFHFITALLGLALFIILAWKSYDYAMTLKSNGEVTAASRVPLYPFAIWIGLCCLPMCLVLLKEMANSVIEVFKR